jgi:hypothetical protein
LPAEVTAARHVTNALQTLLAHVEASVFEPDVVVAAVVVADLLLEPQAASESTIATAATASGTSLGAPNIRAAHLFGAAATSSEPDETSPGSGTPRQCLCNRGILSGE